MSKIPLLSQCLIAGSAGAIASLIIPLALAQTPDQSTSDDAKRGNHSPSTQLAAASPPGTQQDAQKQINLKPLSVIGHQIYYRVSQTNTATGTETPLLDIPQSIQAIPIKVLQDQGAQSLEDAVRNAPGVYVQQGEGNRDEFYIRGVKTKSDFFTDGLRDDTLYYRDLYNIAHVDVLQGPAAILFGRGGAGGVINLVTKPADGQRIRDLSVEAGSWQQLRSTLDVGNAIGQSGAFRFMAMGEHSDGFRDHFFLNRYAFNPKFRYFLGDRTQLDVGFSYLNDNRFEDRGIPSRNGRPVAVPIDKFFGSVDQNRAHTRVEAFNLRIKHTINEHLQVRNAFRVTDNDRFYDMVYPGSAVDNKDQLKLKAYARYTNRLSYIDRAEAVATFATGVLTHKLLSGIEYSWQRDNDRQILPTSGSKTLPGTFPLSNPTTPPVPLPYTDFDNHGVGKELGLYAEDQASWGKHWLALVGVRWDRFNVDVHYRKPGVTPNYTDNVTTAWSPRVGLIYKPVENDSIYASVTQTYTPQGYNIAVSQKSPKGANLAPEKDTNYEIGNKLDLFDGNLSITAALFQLYLKNVVSDAADGSGRLVSTGEQRNRGFELSVAGTLSSKWRVYANYTYLNAEITSTTKDAKAGARVGLVPRNALSIWTVYALTPHWGFGAGIQGASEKYTSYSNKVVLPGYAEFDAMAYYQAKNFRVQINLKNLTDKKYYATASGDNEIMPGAPFGVFASLRVSF